MKHQLPSPKILLALALAIILIIALTFKPQKSHTVIRIHDDQVELQKLTNGIARFIIEKGYGYKVEMVETTIKEARGHLISGDIDITLELWTENNLIWFNEAIQNKQALDLGELYNGGKQYWIVSKWYADKHQIKSVTDMKDHWQDFLDPDDPSKGIFFNCIFGWTCRDINKVKLQAYGLDKYYNTVSPVSPKSLKAIYKNAAKRKLPLFGYYWEPNTIMTQSDWLILEEPSYSKDVWIKMMEAVSSSAEIRLDEACAYNEIGPYKVGSMKLAKKAPDVVTFLEKMRFSTDFFYSDSNKNEYLESTLAPQQVAIQFLKKYPEQWHLWVPEDVRIKIEKSIADFGQTGTTGE